MSTWLFRAGFNSGSKPPYTRGKEREGEERREKMGGGGEERWIFVGVPEIEPLLCFPNTPVLACVWGEGHLRRS